MRDKSKLSWKEALDEAKHLRGGPAPIDQNGDEDTEAEITQKVSSLEEDEKELSTSQSASATVSLWLLKLQRYAQGFSSFFSTIIDLMFYVFC